MSEETSFIQWRDRAKQERKRAGAKSNAVTIAWIAGTVVLLAAVVAVVLILM